jgi:hypothetical protein
MTLLSAVERCLRNHRLPASRFGRQAARDPRLVFDLRRGRQPRAETEAKVLAYIAEIATRAPQVSQ